MPLKQIMDSIILNKIGHIATITLNRPNVFNSFNLLMSKDLHQALNSCDTDQEVRVIILTGEGKAFCAGQDLGEVTNENPPSFETILDDHYNITISKIRNHSKPIICAVNGVAAGAGANIALCCDIVIAKESASFIQAFSKIGLIPDSGGTYFLPRLIGLPKATALMMTGEKVNASQAESMGMIYKSVSDENFENTIQDLAKQISEMPTLALGYIKKLLNQSFNSTMEEQLSFETKMQGLAASTDDYKEGVAAFIEKRKPIFKGK
jgi:2-(1,2-epoxy-1,2-dihydrophenyl)acetyl-CoA isomerase